MTGGPGHSQAVDTRETSDPDIHLGCQDEDALPSTSSPILHSQNMQRSLGAGPRTTAMRRMVRVSTPFKGAGVRLAGCPPPGPSHQTQPSELCPCPMGAAVQPQVHTVRPHTTPTDSIYWQPGGQTKPQTLRKESLASQRPAAHASPNPRRLCLPTARTRAVRPRPPGQALGEPLGKLRKQPSSNPGRSQG